MHTVYARSAPSWLPPYPAVPAPVTEYTFARGTAGGVPGVEHAPSTATISDSPRIRFIVGAGRLFHDTEASDHRRWRDPSMITKFGSLFAGHVDLEDEGLDGTPANDRWLSDERLAEVFPKSEAIAKLMDRTGYDTF